MISEATEQALRLLKPDLELCPRCRCCEMDWQPCETCGGDGLVEYDGEEDGWSRDYEFCDICGGAGGWKMCGGRCDGQGKHAPNRT